MPEILQRRGEPLNTAVALNGDAQPRLLRFVAGLYRPADLRQHLFRQLKQDLPLRRKAQRLTLTHKKPEAEPLFQIAELVRQGRLGLMQRGCRCRQRAAASQCLKRSQVFNLDHESPSLRHEQFALEEYTVTANYSGVNIWTSKPPD